jgi:response regulator NasT
MPNLAVLNLSEPDSSGLALANQLIDEFSLPSIFLSDSDNKALVTQAIDQGAVSCLLKPVSMSTLVPFIRACAAKADEISSIYSMRKHLSQALSSGAETSIATGILMERYKLTDEKAFDVLRTYARSDRRKLQEVADEIVAAVETLNQLNRFREKSPIEA